MWQRIRGLGGAQQRDALPLRRFDPVIEPLLQQRQLMHGGHVRPADPGAGAAE
ncbi:MAG: hypothetical protein ACRDZ4_18755 [Egibacteraceae bacterium]